MGLIYSDIPELEGRDTEIVLQNLKEIEGELYRLIEKRMAHLKELSNAVISDGGELDIIKSILLSLKSDSFDDYFDESYKKNKNNAFYIYSSLSFSERMTICENVCKMLLTKDNFAKEIFAPYCSGAVSNTASERIAYVKNSFTDSVYMQFASMFTSPRVAYFANINDVCESVYNGSCEYCILPVETSSDGKLLSFYSVIMKYEFKIIAVYDLYNRGEKKYTRYALLRKMFLNSILGTEPDIRIKSRFRYFEFFVECSEYPTLTDILCAADYCSLKLRRIDTLNFGTDKPSKDPVICPIFRIDGADINTFLTFLSIDCPKCYPIGIYKQIQ